MNFNLKKKNIHIKNPFTVFEIKNFLKTEDYNDLFRSFPDTEYFDKNEEGITKDAFSSTNEKFDRFLLKNPKWKNFIDNINSEIFIRNAYKESLIPNLKSRGISALKIWTLKDKNFFLKFLYRKVNVKFIFSRIYKSKKIMPHTDATGKLMSMIYYFAENDWSKNSGGNTVFWKTKEKWNNWKNSHVDEKNFDFFTNENEVLHESVFEPNKLICFFKSSCSWHSVKEINPKENNPRKVLNIFIRY